MGRRAWFECDDCGALEPQEDFCGRCDCCLDCCMCEEDGEIFTPSELGFDPEDFDVPLQEKRRDA